MSIAFGTKESAAAGLLRRLGVAASAARDALLDDSRNQDERIHEARRRLKLARAVVAALDEELPDEARRWRKVLKRAARELSGARDADVMLAHAEALRDEASPEEREALVTLCGALAARARAAHQQCPPFREIAERLDGVDEEAGATKLPKRLARRGDPEDDLLVEAIAESYRSGRKAFGRARDSRDSEDLHDWRKAVKQRWYLTRLAERRLAGIDRRQIERLDRLGEIIGEEHDFAVLAAAVAGEPELVGGEAAAADIVAMLDRRRATLADAAFGLGDILYRHRTRDFRRGLADPGGDE